MSGLRHSENAQVRTRFAVSPVGGTMYNIHIIIAVQYYICGSVFLVLNDSNPSDVYITFEWGGGDKWEETYSIWTINKNFVAFKLA